MNKHLEYAKQIAYSSVETLQFTYDMAVKYKDKHGCCFVECGVAAGAQVIAMRSGAPLINIYAFDSFEGIPLPSNKDDQMPGIRMLSKEEQNALPDPGKQELKSSGATSVSLEDFNNHIAASGVAIPFRNFGVGGIYPIKGWFEETVPEFELTEPIAILRLDGDLYNSTLVCIKYLYPKLIHGGLLILDDWELPGCRQAVDDYFSTLNPKKHPKPEWKLVSNIAYFIKP